MARESSTSLRCLVLKTLQPGWSWPRSATREAQNCFNSTMVDFPQYDFDDFHSLFCKLWCLLKQICAMKPNKDADHFVLFRLSDSGGHDDHSEG